MEWVSGNRDEGGWLDSKANGRGTYTGTDGRRAWLFPSEAE